MCCDMLRQLEWAALRTHRRPWIISTLFFSFFLRLLLLLLLLILLISLLLLRFVLKRPRGRRENDLLPSRAEEPGSRCCRPGRERCSKITRTRRHVARSERYSRRTSPIVTANLGQVKHTTLYIVNSSAEKKTVTERQS